MNKRAGKITSVRTTARFVPVRNVEEIADYQAPSAEEAQKVATATKIAPLTNYSGEGFVSMTSEEWDKVPKDYRGTKTIEATETTARHRVRICMGAYCMPSERDFNKRHAYPFVFISNAKRVDPPAAQGAPQSLTFERQMAAPDPQPAQRPAQLATKSEQALQMEDMRATLKAGVKVVTAPQLFPTPAALAEEVATEAQIKAGMTVCDFSAGTAALLAGVHKVTEGRAICTAVEINAALCDHIRGTGLAVAVHQADFLTLRPETFGRFQRIVLNPPFANAEDIAHIEHAIGFLEPGGRITAICANGPRQAQRLGGTFRALPEGVFLSSGTNVRAALFVANVNEEERAQA